MTLSEGNKVETEGDKLTFETASHAQNNGNTIMTGEIATAEEESTQRE